jgi:hypothetical protein
VKTLWTEADRRELGTRIARLAQSVLMATGELPVADRRTPLRFPDAWGVLTWRHADHHLRQLGA